MFNETLLNVSLDIKLLREALAVGSKAMTIGNNVKCKGRKSYVDAKTVVCGAVFVAAFILLAYFLGHAEVVSNPYVPARIF